MGGITDKNEVIKLAKKYLKSNSLLDLTALIEENCYFTHNHSAYVRDIAYKMRTTGKYEIQMVGDRYCIIKVPKKSLKDRYWFLLVFSGWVMGVLTDILKPELKKIILPEKKVSQQAIPRKVDTSVTHKIR